MQFRIFRKKLPANYSDMHESFIDPLIHTNNIQNPVPVHRKQTAYQFQRPVS